MEISSSSPNHHAGNGGILTALPTRLCSKLAGVAAAAKRVAKDDPRRVIHAVKVALAVCLVSVFYYLHPLYGSVGESAIWAVLTVVVMFEFYVGAALGKGINRMIATCVAGGLAVGAHQLAYLSGEVGEPIILLLSAFLVAFIFTFLRFIPELKARYDYGLMIFILTFSMVAAFGYGEKQVLSVAWKRLVTIIIGCCIAIVVCIFICPFWSGEDLHNLIASNLDKLGSFLEGFGGECFKGSVEVKDEGDKSFLVKYKSVLTTKVNEDTMANFARWEPRHGQFRFRHPWMQYLKMGTLARQCAYKIDALNNQLNSASQVQPEIREHLKEKCVRLSSKSGKVLKELSNGLKKMKRISPTVKGLVREVKSEAKELKSLLESKGLASEGFSLLDFLLVATIASMLIEITTFIEEITEAIHEFDNLVHLKVAVESAVAPEEPSGEGEYAMGDKASDKDNREGDGHVVVVINEVVQGGFSEKLQA